MILKRPLCGPRGDELVRRLIEQASARLRPGGLLALEIASIKALRF